MGFIAIRVGAEETMSKHRVPYSATLVGIVERRWVLGQLADKYLPSVFRLSVPFSERSSPHDEEEV